MGVVCGVRMGVEVCCVGTREESVVSSGRSVSVADGRGTGWRDCCRLPNGISGKLWEDLPYSFPFILSIGDVSCRLVWKEEVVKVIEALTYRLMCEEEYGK